MKKVVHIFVVVVLPISILLSQSVEDACAQAKIDAKNNINGYLWFASGVVYGAGWVVASMVEPKPDASSLEGKSAEYIAAYTECYTKAGLKYQKKKAKSGCLTCVTCLAAPGILMGVMFYVFGLEP